MTERKIDYDRGVIIKAVPELGMEIFMYRDQPGVYWSASGTEVPEVLAKRAGFDVDRLAKMRQHAEHVATVSKAYAAELQLGQTRATREIIKERNGFKVVLLGGTRHVILGPDDEELTKGMPLNEQVALRLLDDLAPPEKADVSA